MKKITLFITLVSSSLIIFSQNYSTGVVTLDSDFTVKFDINTTTNKVTMSLVGPDNVWLAVAPGVSGGNSMGNANNDCIVFNSSGLQDRHMTGSTSTPSIDTTQNWNISSNTINSNVRTLIATRTINTGDSKDFVFPTTVSSIPILWAKGNSMSFGYHEAKGAAVSNLTLGIDNNSIISNLKITPNPASDKVNIKLPNGLSNTMVIIYNNLGKHILSKSISKLNTTINISTLTNGIYLAKFTTNSGETVTKKILKQ